MSTIRLLPPGAGTVLPFRLRKEPSVAGRFLRCCHGQWLGRSCLEVAPPRGPGDGLR